MVFRGGRQVGQAQHGEALDLQLDVLAARQVAQRLDDAGAQQRHAVSGDRAQVTNAQCADALLRGVLRQQEADQQLVAAALENEIGQEASCLPLRLDEATAHGGDGGADAALPADDELVGRHLCQVGEGGAGLRRDAHVVALHVRDERRDAAALADLELVLVRDGQVGQGGAALAEDLHVFAAQQALQRLQAAFLHQLHLHLGRDAEAAQRRHGLLLDVWVMRERQGDHRLDAAFLHHQEMVDGRAAEVRQRARHVVLRHRIRTVGQRVQRLQGLLLENHGVVRHRGAQVRQGQARVPPRFQLDVHPGRNLHQRPHGTGLNHLDLRRHGGREIGEAQGGEALAVHVVGLEGCDHRQEHAFSQERLLDVGVGGEVGHGARRFALGVQRGVKLDELHEVGEGAAGVPLHLWVSAEKHGDEVGDARVHDLNLVLLHARQAVEGRGDLSEDLHLLGASHQQEGLKRPLADAEDAILRRDAQTSQSRERLPLGIEIVLTRERDKAGDGTGLHHLRTMVRVGRQVAESKG
eukprot:scaffold1509_cov240-Pinguiococcus_pyrenoidosus.AAC.9